MTTRPASLVAQEVTLLRRLVQGMQVSDPRRPELLIRMAATLREHATILKQARSSDDELRRAYTEANTTYAQLIQEYPNHPRLEEAYFGLGDGLERVGQSDRSLQVYMALATRNPTGRWTAQAFLRIGTILEQGDSVEDARAAYGRAGAAIGPSDLLYGFVQVRLASAEMRLHHYERAFAALSTAFRATAPERIFADWVPIFGELQERRWREHVLRAYAVLAAAGQHSTTVTSLRSQWASATAGSPEADALIALEATVAACSH